MPGQLMRVGVQGERRRGVAKPPRDHQRVAARLDLLAGRRVSQRVEVHFLRPFDRAHIEQLPKASMEGYAVPVPTALSGEHEIVILPPLAEVEPRSVLLVAMIKQQLHSRTGEFDQAARAVRLRGAIRNSRFSIFNVLIT